MKRLVALCVLLLPLSLGLTADGFLVKIPVPQEESVLQQSGFQLYGRAEGFWIGRLPEGAALPAGMKISVSLEWTEE